METTEGNIQSKDIASFPTARKNLVVEIGHGGPLTIRSSHTSSYLEKKDANYLGIEMGGEQHNLFNAHVKNKKINWAKDMHTSVFRVEEELQGIANEVWIRNFRNIGKGHDTVLEEKLFTTAKNMLAAGGQLVLVNSYDQLPEGGIEKVKGVLENLRFEVKEVDPEDDNHPLIAAYQVVEKQMPASLHGITPTKYAYIATKVN